MTVLVGDEPLDEFLLCHRGGLQEDVSHRRVLDVGHRQLCPLLGALLRVGPFVVELISQLEERFLHASAFFSIEGWI